jgi:hypothetical protein
MLFCTERRGNHQGADLCHQLCVGHVADVVSVLFLNFPTGTNFFALDVFFLCVFCLFVFCSFVCFLGDLDRRCPFV